ncbi:MAG: hypothetical protein RI924_1066 [Bacteroidota bacterium]|jgi:hypothetical protein
MNLTITNHTLEKLESILSSSDYKVRYEKGNFKTGACVLENSRVVVINKFSNLENKIQGLASLIQLLDIETELLDDKQKQLLRILKQTNLKL